MKEITSLDKIPANRSLIEDLFAHEKITKEAKEYALSYLYPADKWAVWSSRILLALGVGLILSGIIFFFAFNWAAITPVIKFSSLQIAIVLCLGGAYFFSLKHIAGQSLLLSASVLVGVFMAVFGQVYQTGADAYQLFMMWAILTLGWTIISHFAAQWIFWVVICNLFMSFWWRQAALPELSLSYMIFAILMIFNGAALALYEYYAVVKGVKWLEPRWIRLFFAVMVILQIHEPVFDLVTTSRDPSISLLITSVLGIVGYVILYILYRYKIKDIWPLCGLTLSLCLIVEWGGLEYISDHFHYKDFSMFLLMGILTIVVFSVAVILLRKIMKDMGEEHV